MNRDHAIVAVIPAYNEEATVGKVVQQAGRYVTKVIVCDDGSTDETAAIAKANGATVVRHNQNAGYGTALSTLFKEARKLDPDVVVSLDADGQHDPSYIPALVAPIFADDIDIVVGSRFLSRKALEKIPAYRRFGIKMITKLTNRAAGGAMTDAQSGLIAYSRKALYLIMPKEQRMGAVTEIIVKAREKNLRIKETPVTISYGGRKSTHNPLTQSFQVVITTLKLASIQTPRIFCGVPALTALVVALGLWIDVSLIFAETERIPTDLTLVALGATITCMILALVARALINERKSKHGMK